MRRIRYIVWMVVLLALNLAQTAPSYGQATPDPKYVPIWGFHLVSPTEGWVWTGPVYGTKDTGHLYWTKDSGQTWTDITPTNLNGMEMGAVAFVDSQQGSVIGTTGDPTTFHAVYTIFQTTDGGKTWGAQPLSVSSATKPTWYPGRISLQFLDAHAGWLRVQEATSSNRDTGTLFKTSDGGATWTALENLPRDGFSEPIGDPVYFVTEQLGWIAGRLGGGSVWKNLLYRTQDGGQTWQTQTVGVVPSWASERNYQLPQFVNAKDGLLAVIDRKGISSSLEVYITHDSGVTWQLDSTIAGYGPVKLVDSTHWIGVVRGKGVVKRTIAQAATPTILSQDPAVMEIVDMDFVSPSIGLAHASTGSCTTPQPPTPRECAIQHQLLHTGDGGQTWQRLTLPKPSTS